MRQQSRVAAALGAAVLAGVAIVLAAISPIEAWAAAQTPPPQLQGSWKLNPDLTSKLSKDAGPEQEPQQGGKRHGGRGGGDVTTGGAGVGSHGSDMPDVGLGTGTPAVKEKHDTKPLDAVLGSLEHVSIALAPGQVTITYVDGRARVLKTNGSSVRDAAAPGGPEQARASLDKDGNLVVEVRPDKGARHTETYEVSNDGKHLYVTVAFANGFMARETTALRAYDVMPAAGASPAAAPAAPPAAPAAPPPPARR